MRRQTIDFAAGPAHLLRLMIRVHGTAVALGEDGLLLRGPSGSGKSDLALRLIDEGGQLVADDQTELKRCDSELFMSAPAAIAGCLEVRGVGLLRLPSRASAPLRLVVELKPLSEIERLPEPQFCELDGVLVPALSLAPFTASATARLRFALRAMKAPQVAGAFA